MASVAVQVRRELDQDKAGSNPTRGIRPWSPARPSRVPYLPPQGLKLRDVNIFIIDERCKGCNFCIEFCPLDVLELSKKVNQIGIHPPQVKDSLLCVGCGVCEDICPDFAIFLIDKGELHSRND
jgi:2-oxoglutarate ferredoxin oxidoreductase subunit delta